LALAFGVSFFCGCCLCLSATEKRATIQMMTIDEAPPNHQLPGARVLQASIGADSVRLQVVAKAMKIHLIGRLAILVICLIVLGLMSGHFCLLEKRHSSPRERRLTLAQCFSAG
jgi:hypothetical protein